MGTKLNKKGLLDPAYRLSDREHATVLAALRLWQQTFEGAVHTTGDSDSIAALHSEIATNGGTVKPLGESEIDLLCERLNCGGGA